MMEADKVAHYLNQWSDVERANRVTHYIASLESALAAAQKLIDAAHALITHADDNTGWDIKLRRAYDAARKGTT